MVDRARRQHLDDQDRIGDAGLVALLFPFWPHSPGHNDAAGHQATTAIAAIATATAVIGNRLQCRICGFHRVRLAIDRAAEPFPPLP